MPKPRIFLSMATDEFEPLRVRLTKYLKRSGCDVEVQNHFENAAEDMVEKLANKISHPVHGPVHLLVHVIGHNIGSTAEPSEVASFVDSLNGNPAFLSTIPKLRQQLGDLQGVTYTQWEAFLAFHFDVDLLAYAPDDAFEKSDRGKIKGVRPDFVQTNHLARLRLCGKHAEPFADTGDLFGKIMADVRAHFDKRKGESSVIADILRQHPDVLEKLSSFVDEQQAPEDENEFPEAEGLEDELRRAIEINWERQWGACRAGRSSEQPAIDQGTRKDD